MGSAGQRHSRLQKPEMHIGAHVEDSAGQRLAELDSRIKQMIHTYLRRLGSAATLQERMTFSSWLAESAL